MRNGRLFGGARAPAVAMGLALAVGCGAAEVLGDGNSVLSVHADGAEPVPDGGVAFPTDADDGVPFAALPWADGADIGHGVASKTLSGASGASVLVAYAGYGIGAGGARAWAAALFEARFAAAGVRRVYAVQGPASVSYAEREMGNSRIAAALLDDPPVEGARVFVVAHSSGSFVAHELLAQLADGRDASGVTDGRVVYWNLDGGQAGFQGAAAGRLAAFYAVGARDGARGTHSPNRPTMQGLGAAFPSLGGYLEVDVRDAGCTAGAAWCVHSALVSSRPHVPTGSGGESDYTDFAGRPVETRYLDVVLGPPAP